MNLFFRFCISGLVSVVLLTSALVVQAQPTKEAFFEQLSLKLALTENQKASVKPILFVSLEKSRAILQNAGVQQGEKPGLLQMLKIKGPLDRLREETLNQLSQHLSVSQMDTYKAVMAEVRKRALSN